VEGMQAAMRAGLDPNSPCNKLGWFPIHSAAFKGHTDIVKHLVEELGSDVDLRNAQGETPLVLAAMYDHADTVEYLLQKGANPRATVGGHRSLLDQVKMAFVPNDECVRLIEEALNPKGNAPLKCAVCRAPADKRCARCKSAAYCSQECQRKDWKTHKATCVASQ